MYVMKILKTEILCHLGDNLLKKGYFVSYMVNKLLQVFLGRKEPDDRDSYVNKRIDMLEYYWVNCLSNITKMFVDIRKIFEKAYSGDNENPVNVINQIKYTTIKQGLKNGLATGIWGIHKAKGVAQALQRYFIYGLYHIFVELLLNQWIALPKK